jgi:ADP-heptose:LPS heptosyltransferase
MKLLVICLGNTGDLLLTTPVLRCLKQQLAEAEIHYLVHPHHHSVLEVNPYVDQFHFNIGSTELLKQQQFDQIIDLQHDGASTAVIKALKKPASRYRKLTFQQFILKNLSLNLMPAHDHIVHRFFETVASIGVRNDGAGLDYFIPANQEVTEKDIPASHQFGFVAIAFGNTKQLPTARVQELCKLIDHPVMLIGERRDFSKAESIASFDPIKVYNACGKFTLHETADLLRKSKMVIAHEGPLMQVAAAFKKPVIAVWGSGSPLAGKAPYYGGSTNLLDHVKLNHPLTEIVKLVNRILVPVKK